LTTTPRPTRPPAFEPLTAIIASRRYGEPVAGPRPESAAPPHFPARVVLLAVDIAAVNLAFYLAWFARYRLGLVRDLDPGNYVDHDKYLPLQIALSLTFVFILGLRGLYRLPRAASALDDLSTVFTVAGLSVMLLFAGSTFVRYPAESRLTLIFAWALMTVLVVLGRAI
jgi:hypothetical protein